MKVKKALSPPDHNENRSSDAKQLSPERQFDRDLSMKKEALEQIHRQAAEGDPQAQYELDHFLASQDNAVEHRKKCVELLRAASEKGNQHAQYALGNWYIHGIGVRKNHKKAYEYFLLSAKQGHPIAQYEVGVCLSAGHGIGNVGLAVKWYTKAANQGYTDAQKALAELGSS